MTREPVDGEVIDVEEYNRLPEHKRAVRTVFLRLPDPPAVAALRRVYAEACAHHEDCSCDLPEYVRDVAGAALAEFDETSS